MKTTLFLSLLLSFTLMASVDFTPQKNLFIEGSSCDEIKPHAQDILDWSHSINENKDVSLSECFCSESKCHIDVFPLSPYFVKKIIKFDSGWSTSTEYNGPNCFNEALVSAQALPSLNFTSPTEIHYILESPICQQRTLEETLRPGDIIIIRDQDSDYNEVHAATYISDDLSFSKYGLSNMMPYSYGLNIFRSYGVHKHEYRRLYGEPAKDSSCYNQPYANYYHCMPLYKYVATLEEKIKSELAKIYPIVSIIDGKVSRIAVDGGTINRELIIKAQDGLRELFIQLTTILKNEPLSETEITIANLLRNRVDSLFTQTRYIAHRHGHKDLVAPITAKK